MAGRRARGNMAPLRNSYHAKYGVTRQDRANRMFNNQAPIGLPQPQTGRAYPFGVASDFSARSRYVEELFSANWVVRPEVRDHAYVVVRSQKFTPRNRVYYRVGLTQRLSMLPLQAVEVLPRSCTCPDYTYRGTRTCKHMMAVRLSFARGRGGV